MTSRSADPGGADERATLMAMDYEIRISPSRLRCRALEIATITKVMRKARNAVRASRVESLTNFPDRGGAHGDLAPAGCG